jgi:hypothetical protein
MLDNDGKGKIYIYEFVVIENMHFGLGMTKNQDSVQLP